MIAYNYAMSEFSLTLVLLNKTSIIIYGMANISKKTETLTQFSGILHVVFDYIRDGLYPRPRPAQSGERAARSPLSSGSVRPFCPFREG